MKNERQRTKRAILWLLVFSGVVLFLAGNLFAQIAVGGVTGVIKDSQGAVVPDALVTLANQATNVAQDTKSSSTGVYVFNAVNPGAYVLTVSKSGFDQFVSRGIEVHIQATVNINVALVIGGVSQRVTVTAGAPILETQDASVGQTITNQEIDSMPLENRDWTSLGQLAPGVTTQPGGKPTDSLTENGGWSSQGGMASQNDIRLDGIDDNQEMWTQGATILPPPDAIQEFTLQSSNFSAEFGHSTGGIVNAALKSGTNQLHGALWDYVRNDAFNANDYFTKQAGLPRSKYTQNVFGGTVGGPVLIPHLYDGRNKTFFFFDYQGTRRNVAASAAGVTSTVPTQNMISSDFTNFQDLFALASGATSVSARARPCLTGFTGQE